MKKALALFFSLMALSVAYSAQVHWGVTIPSSFPAIPDTGAVKGALVYLVEGSNPKSVLDAVTASESAAADFISSYTSKTDWTGTLSAQGKVAAHLADVADAGTYFVIIFTPDHKYALASDTKDLILYNDTNADSANQLFTGFTSYGTEWKAVTIPEPTVLALLALGVAGLALKRKNA